MLDHKGFDLWADGYDRAVGLSDEEHSYPFAGYKDVLGNIFARVTEKGPCRVLDLGFGTGVLAKRLYDAGCRVFGQDYSKTMIAIAQEAERTGQAPKPWIVPEKVKEIWRKAEERAGTEARRPEESDEKREA